MHKKSQNKGKSRTSWRQYQASSKKKHLWIDRKTETHARFMALLFFIGFALIIIFGIKTIISWLAVSRIVAAIAVICSFIPNKYFPLLYRVRKELKVIFTIFALTPMVTGLILLINYLIITDIQIESYKISKIESYRTDHMFSVHLENDIYKEHKQIRAFSFYEYRYQPDSAHFKTGKGIFRMKVVRKSYLTTP